jgi:hypothetical protein
MENMAENMAEGGGKVDNPKKNPHSVNASPLSCIEYAAGWRTPLVHIYFDVN